MASYVIYGLDWSNEREMIETLGPAYQKKVGECLIAYYSVLNHLAALGSVEKMYIPPVMRRDAGTLDNQRLYEQSVARDLELEHSDQLLELGCGRGRVAAHIAQISGAQVTAVNIDANQLASARSFNDELGLGNTFVEQDFNDLPLPFANESFDGFYEIQALSLSRDLPRLFVELFRVLKPGAKVSLLEWVSLPDYDPGNPTHADMMRRVKPLLGVVGTPTPQQLENGLQAAGFVIRHSDNASLDGLQAQLIENVDIWFRLLRAAITTLVALRILPAHFKTLMDRLVLDGKVFVEMDRQRLVTSSYRIVAEKP